MCCGLRGVRLAGIAIFAQDVQGSCALTRIHPLPPSRSVQNVHIMPAEELSKAISGFAFGFIQLL